MRSNCNTNFLAPTGFQLDIPGFNSVSFQCVSANIPGVTMGGPTQATPLNDFQLSGDKLLLAFPSKKLTIINFLLLNFVSDASALSALLI